MSDTTTGTTSPLSMENAKTLKFIAELQGQIAELQAKAKEDSLMFWTKIEQLEQALRRYGHHQDGCFIELKGAGASSCSCGLIEAMKLREGK